MFALLFAAAALAQDTVACDAIDGSGLRYEQWSKSGGTPPAPDTITSTETWKVGEVVLSAVENTESEGSRQTIARAARFEWQTDRTVVLTSDPDPTRAVTTYTTEVLVRQRVGGPRAPTLPASQRTVPMTCREVAVCCIP